MMLDSKQKPENYNEKINSYLNVLEILSQSTDDYLFLLDVKNDKNWFFGDVEKNYNLIKEDNRINTTEEMMNIIHPADRKKVSDDIEELVQGKKDVHDMEYRWVNKNGQSVWISCRGKVIKDEEGKPFVMIGRVSEEAMRHLFNPLTGLFNKIRMMEDLKRDFPTFSGGYFMLIDVDDLAGINLSRGRKTGDEVLKHLAEILEEIAKDHKVYHVEYNHFALCIDVNTEQEVTDKYKYIQQEMLDRCTVTASAVPVKNSMITDHNVLYDSAKLMLKKARRLGKNHVVVFSKETFVKKISNAELLEEIQEGLANNCEGFYLNYQPKIQCETYNMVGVEALLRYNSKTRGRVFPDEFIPLLEQSGLIKHVGLWVLREALTQCKKWREKIEDLRISVNFSTVQFEEDDIVENIIGILNEVGVSGEILTIEITESVQLHGIKHFAEIIKQLKKEGIKISVDDFGTGYSNLGYLKFLDIDELKIDRTFVQGIEEATYNYKLVSNIVDFAKNNSFDICCEGVEEIRELNVLEKLDPNCLQGYLFDKPLESHEFECSYINCETDEYKKRIEFIKKLCEDK